jgi:hypothetical protein
MITGGAPAALSTRGADSTMSTWDGPTRAGLELRLPTCATTLATLPLRIATAKSQLVLLKTVLRPE